MNIKGANVKGLSVFPVTEKALLPCNHKYGAITTWSQCTDTIQVGYANGEINAFKNNLQATAFVSPVYPGVDTLNIYNSKRIGLGIYFQTEYWQNPVTHANEVISDFNSAIWTQAGADSGLIAQGLVGTAKTVGYPQHGQQMFDLTSGLYGYDAINDVVGTIDVLAPYIQYNLDWFKSLTGRYPSCASYGYGRVGGAYKMYDYFLGCRNSAYDYESNYNFNHLASTIRATTTRQHDMMLDLSKTRAEVQALCIGYLQNAIANNGWYTDFTHWHSTIDTEMTEYYANQRATIGSSDVITLDFGTALEHKFLRDMVRRISIYTEGTQLVLVVDIKNNDELKLDCIETPLSVDVDLTSTILEGKEIVGISDKGIRKLGTNHFSVEVPYGKSDGFQTVTLSETVTPAYLDFALPTISSVTKVTSNTVSVVTNKPTNVVLFSVTRGGQLYTATILKRDSTMSLNHSVDVTGIDFSVLDIYVGVITKEKQSVLSNAYQL